MNPVISIIETLWPNKFDVSNLNLEADLIKDLGLGSLDIIILFSALEEKFAVDIFDHAETVENIYKISSLVNVVSTTDHQKVV